MRFGSKMDHRVKIMFSKKRQDKITIRDITPYVSVIAFCLDIAEVLQVTGIGELIQVHDVMVRVLVHEQAHHMGTDKARTPGDQYFFQGSIFKDNFFEFTESIFHLKLLAYPFTSITLSLTKRKRSS